MNKLAWLALLALLLASLAACGGTNPTTITMGAATFNTASVSISAGSTITFSDDAMSGEMHVLLIGTNGKAQSEKARPILARQAICSSRAKLETPPWNQTGTYHVTCQFHPQSMNLTVTVTAASHGY